MAQVKAFRPKDLARLLATLPRIAQLPIRRLDHDRQADVLYLSFEHPQRATDSELKEDGVIVHRRGRKIVGLTIVDASQR